MVAAAVRAGAGVGAPEMQDLEGRQKRERCCDGGGVGRVWEVEAVEKGRAEEGG
jgi:hypothetical protein